MFGNPETTTGGNALKFYSSLRLDVRRIGAIKEASPASGRDPMVVGNRTRVKIVKNKMAPPFREVEFDILYGQGISRSGDVIDLATDQGIIEKSGAWFSFQGERIGQGRENAKAYLEQRPELMEKLESLILAKHGIQRGPGRASDATPAKADAKANDGKTGAAPAKNGEVEGKKPPVITGKPAN
jgi:recombination protein RecA